MKKYVCFLVLLAFLPTLHADDNKDKKKKAQQLLAPGKKPAATSAAGGVHLPGTPHTGTQPHNPGQGHPNNFAPGGHPGSQPGHHTAAPPGSNSTGNTSAAGANKQNPLMRRGGQPNANGKGNPLTQKNNQTASTNPMLKGKSANATGQKNVGQLDHNAHHVNSMTARDAHLGNHMTTRTLAHGSRANYHVRPYREVFHTYHPIHHDRGWYRTHYDRVVAVGGGYYYWDAGYWYPAWGYDPVFAAYVYDGPIYSYDNLPPDQVIVNVQTQLQDQGYYTGEVDGQLGPQTRDALGAFQADHDLEVTSAVDEPTVEALGLPESS